MTVGSKIAQHNAKGLTLEDDVREYTNEMALAILAEIHQTIELAKKQPNYQNKNFYIVLVKNVDRVLGQPKFQTLARISCPTPVYKQDVFKYHHVSGELEYLWTIPDMYKYYHILHNKQKYYENQATRRLCKFVVLMETGELLKWVKKENGEKIDAVIQINKENDGRSITRH